MNDFCYCYWLQGFFELIKPIELNARQVDIIKEHLDLVEPKEGIFCNWLSGYFEMAGISAWSEAQTQKVKNKLREEFLYVIDPTYPPEEQKILFMLHENKS